ncbi:MAG TPA: CbiQ family ECF transporter T component, partial [Rectinemataceae bacterium]|nr:CbiQ family ECF transporter T component [Rectinemataceae bacterium]
MARLELFRFEWDDSALHRLHPLSKLAVLLILSWAALAPAPRFLAFLFALALVLLALVRAKPADLARNARFLLPLYLFVALMRVVAPGSPTWFHADGLLPASVYMARLALVFLFAETFFRSTSTGELADAATRCARTLPGLSASDPGFYLSLTMGFIPRCIEAYERSREAAYARALGLGRRRDAAAPGGADRRSARESRGRPDRMSANALPGPRGRRTAPGGVGSRSLFVLESFVAAALRSALRSAAALEARSYNPRRTVAPRPIRRSDILVPLA